VAQHVGPTGDSAGPVAQHVGPAGHPAGPVAHPDDVVVPALDDASDLGLCLPFIVFAKTFALLQSLALEIRPDSPNAAGAVNRVVQGVSIYRLGRPT
jgi:hypothetical protein